MRQRQFAYSTGTLAAREALANYHRELDLEILIPLYLLLRPFHSKFRAKHRDLRWELLDLRSLQF